MAEDIKISVVIPYRDRLASLGSVFAALAEQSLDASEFEVVLGVLEYSTAYVELCREYADRLRIVSVLEDVDWNVSRARNAALRQACAPVTVVMDADMVLPPHALESVWNKHFAAGQEVCVLGQALGYSCVVEDLGGSTELTMASVDAVEQLPYTHYRDLLRDLRAANLVWADDRSALETVTMPWTLCWSGLVALPTAAVRRDGLTFDEGFTGWGSEDQEWGYRIEASGLPIVLGEDFYAMHLAHSRDTAGNQESYRANSRYFLRKWPNLQVEVSRAFGWEEGNRVYPQIAQEMAAASGEAGSVLGVVRGPAEGRDLLVVGAPLNAAGAKADADVSGMFDAGADLEILPLAGMALPYADQSVSECRILPAVLTLGDRFRDLVLAETARVASVVSTVATASAGAASPAPAGA